MTCLRPRSHSLCFGLLLGTSHQHKVGHRRHCATAIWPRFLRKRDPSFQLGGHHSWPPRHRARGSGARGSNTTNYHHQLDPVQCSLRLFDFHSAITIFDPNLASSIGSNSTFATSFGSVDHQDVPENMDWCEDDSGFASGFPNSTPPQVPYQAHCYSATFSTGGAQSCHSSQQNLTPSPFPQPHAPHPRFGRGS